MGDIVKPCLIQNKYTKNNKMVTSAFVVISIAPAIVCKCPFCWLTADSILYVKFMSRMSSSCGGLNGNGTQRLKCLNTWSIWSGVIRRHDLGVGMVLLE